MNDSLMTLSAANVLVTAGAFIVFLTIFRDSVKGLLRSLEEAGASIGRLFLAGSAWALAFSGADEDFAKATAPETIGRRPDIARQLLGAVLACLFFLAMNAVDWASLTLALQGMLGMGDSGTTPAKWVAFLDKSLALAILLPTVYAAWHLAELLGFSHLFTITQTTAVWRRVHLGVASLAFGLSLTCGAAVAVYRALSLVSSLEPSPIPPTVLTASLTPLTVTTMVTMVLSLMLCAALAFETGVAGVLRLLPAIAFVFTHGVLWFIAKAWGAIFALLNRIHAILLRLGTVSLRIPHSMLVMANRWALHTTGSWRWIGIPVAIITSFVYDIDFDEDPRLVALFPAVGPHIAASAASGAPYSAYAPPPSIPTASGTAAGNGSGAMRSAA